MLESGAPIIPVYYGVRPCDLRSTRTEKSMYARALQDLESKKTHEDKLQHDPATVEKWRNDLSRAADISGFELATYKE